MTPPTVSIGDLLAAGFVPVDVAGVVYYSFTLVDGIELALKPLLFDRWALALYVNGQLVLNSKVEMPARR